MTQHFPIMDTLLVVPGLHGSGPDHWQTWFEAVVRGARRVEQADWDAPVLPIWADRVGAEIAAAPSPVWIVAHSFGCLAAVAAASNARVQIRGALLVAPADPHKFNIPDASLQQQLPFPSMVVASETDPWLSLEAAAKLAVLWGSRFVNIGRAGHINVDSGFGPWPQGLELFNSLRRQRIDCTYHYKEEISHVALV
jgi:predicted alpha/beta hydrolase family esterase